MDSDNRRDKKSDQFTQKKMPPFSSDTHTSGDNSQVETNTEAISSNAVGLEAHSSYLTTLSATQSGLMTALTSVGEKADSNTAAIVTNSAELVNLNTGFSGLGASLIGFMGDTTVVLATKADKDNTDNEIAALNSQVETNTEAISSNAVGLEAHSSYLTTLSATQGGMMTALTSVGEKTDENTAAILKNSNALVAKATVNGSDEQSFKTENLTVSGTIDVAGELIIDGVAEIGQGKIGVVPGQGDTNVGFAKTNNFTSTNYALLQYNGGATNLNAASGTSLTFTKGDTATMVCKPDDDWDIRTNLHVFNKLKFGDSIIGTNHGTLGQIPGMAQNVGFSKTNFFNQTDFALAQYDTGQVDLNAPANAGLYLKQGGVSKMSINASNGEIDVQTNVNVDGDLTIAGASVSTVLNTLTAGAIVNTSAIESLTVKTQTTDNEIDTLKTKIDEFDEVHVNIASLIDELKADVDDSSAQVEANAGAIVVVKAALTGKAELNGDDGVNFYARDVYTDTNKASATGPKVLVSVTDALTTKANLNGSAVESFTVSDLYFRESLTSPQIISLKETVDALNSELAELKGPGTVAQVVTFQTRDMKLNDDGVNIGYSILENNTSLGRLTKTQGQLSHIDKFQDVVISPKSAGNKILISFVLSYSVTGDFADWGFVVTRFNRVTQEEIMIAFNDGPSNRAILATEFDGSIDHADDDATGIWNVITGPVADNRNNRSNATTVRITDESCLDVSTTYRLYVRGTDNANTNRTIFYLNGPGGDMSPGRGAAGTTSSLTLTEIRSGGLVAVPVVPVPVTVVPVLPVVPVPVTILPVVPVVLVP